MIFILNLVNSKFCFLKFHDTYRNIGKFKWFPGVFYDKIVYKTKKHFQFIKKYISKTKGLNNFCLFIKTKMIKI